MVECFWFEYGSRGSCHTRRLCWLWCHGFAGWVRPLLENCIVDASIFEIFQDCDREMVGPCAFGCVVPCFVVILVSVIVVLFEVF